MRVETLRFGTLEVEKEDLIRFPEGLVGLSRLRQFVLFRDPRSADLYWLQSTDQAELAWALVHASKLGSAFCLDWNEVDLKVLDLADLCDAEVFLVLNRVKGDVTCNLKGPIIVNASRMVGKQVVLSSPQFDVRHPLRAVMETAQLAAASA